MRRPPRSLLVTAGVFLGLLTVAPAASAARSPQSVLPARSSAVQRATMAGAAKTLPFTWYGQERYYYCGPGATRMVLSARMSSPPSQSTLGAYMGTDTNGTDDISNVVGALNHYLNTGWYERKPVDDPPTAAQRDLLKQDLLYDIDRGWAIVANVVSGWRPPGYPSGTIYHYVAVVGYADGGDSAVIADPAGAGAGGSGWINVPKTYTISTWDLGTWIGLKAYAA
jgi:Peptidase_C39 like family